MGKVGPSPSFSDPPSSGGAASALDTADSTRSHNKDQVVPIDVAPMGRPPHRTIAYFLVQQLLRFILKIFFRQVDILNKVSFYQVCAFTCLAMVLTALSLSRLSLSFLSLGSLRRTCLQSVP